MSTTTSRNARLDFRLSSQNKRLIEEAAAAHGQSVSDFAVTSLVRLAQETIDQATTTRLSLRDRNAFLELLDADAKPNKSLKAAAHRYKKRRA